MGAVAEVSWAIMDRAEESIWISFNGWSAEEKAADWIYSHNSAANDALGLHPVKLENWPDYLRSEEHTSELQSLMRISYAVFCLKKKKKVKVKKSLDIVN